MSKSWVNYESEFDAVLFSTDSFYSILSTFSIVIQIKSIKPTQESKHKLIEMLLTSSFFSK